MLMTKGDGPVKLSLSFFIVCSGKMFSPLLPSTSTLGTTLSTSFTSRLFPGNCTVVATLVLAFLVLLVTGIPSLRVLRATGDISNNYPNVISALSELRSAHKSYPFRFSVLVFLTPSNFSLGFPCSEFYLGDYSHLMLYPK